MPDLARLAGEALCVGFVGTTPEDAPLDELRELGPCGVVLFARNVTTLEGTRKLVRSVRGALGPQEPFVCLDQEGGRVARLRFGGDVPSMLTVSATGDPGFAERSGARLGADVAGIGANVDFAPVLDLALAREATVFITRTFGDDPQRAAGFGAAVLRGIASSGVAATAKHFPGHGDSPLDPHVDFPVIDAPAQTIRARELAPFVKAIESGVPAVMSAHAILKAFDDVPATLSRAVLTGLLREELGFEGVAFTDCLQMHAIAQGVGTPRGAVLALGAGADAVLISHDLDIAREARDAIVAAVSAGELPVERLEEALRRTRALRARLERLSTTRDRAGKTRDEWISTVVARAAIASLRGDPRIDAGAPVTVVSFESATSDGIAGSQIERPSLSLALRRRRVRSESFRVALDPDDAMVQLLLDVVGAQLAQGPRTIVALARRADLHPMQAQALRALCGAVPDTIGVSVLEPFDAEFMDGARAVLCTFGDEEVNIEALADALTGRIEPRGSLPVTIGPLA